MNFYPLLTLIGKVVLVDLSVGALKAVLFYTGLTGAQPDIRPLSFREKKMAAIYNTFEYMCTALLLTQGFRVPSTIAIIAAVTLGIPIFMNIVIGDTNQQ